MSLHDFAALQSRIGVRVVNRHGQYWRQVRPFFYRPLLPVEAYADAAVRPPGRWPSSYQYVVSAASPSNSTMSFLMLDDLAGYSVESLSHKRRQLISQAARIFQVRRVMSPSELKESGHRVYLSFYHRTGYSYRADRQDRQVFARWVDALFSNPKTIVLGGYGPDGLGAILVLYWINHTLVCSSLICDTASLQKKLGELMFHEIRRLSAQQPGIREVFVRGYQGGNSLDQYYLLRGCHLARKPARLEMPVFLRALARFAMPRKYDLLHGDD